MPRDTYVAFLKANGATEDDIKALTEGTGSAAAIRAFDAAQAKEAELQSKANEAIAERDKTRSWYNDTALPFVEGKQNELTAAKAEAARAKAAILDLQERGLTEVAKELGYLPADNGGAGRPPAGVPAMDPSKYLTTEDAFKLADAEGNAIATAFDIAAEHATLFPGQRLNMRSIREDAKRRKVSVEQAWMDQYKIPEARAAQDAKNKAADEARVRADERQRVEAEYATKTFQPGAGTFQPSRSVFAAPKGREADKDQPWAEAGGSDTNRQARRTERALRAEIESRQQVRPN